MMPHHINGHTWYFHRMQYWRKFGIDVPPWVQAFDRYEKVRPLQAVLHIGMPLPQAVMDESDFREG